MHSHREWQLIKQVCPSALLMTVTTPQCVRDTREDPGDKIKNIQKVEENLISYKTLFEENIPIVRISAKTGRNKDTLLNYILKKLPEGEKLYPDDIVTEESMRSVAEEIIREKILVNTQDEIPHSVAITINNYEEKEDIYKILATI